MTKPATACAFAGRHHRALRPFERVIEKMEAQLEADHHSIPVTMTNLATAYRDAGRFDEAEPLMRRAVAGARRKLGSGHPRTQLYLQDLAKDSRSERAGR